MAKKNEINKHFEDADFGSQNHLEECSPSSENCYCNPADWCDPDEHCCHPHGYDSNDKKESLNSPAPRVGNLAFFLDSVKEEDLECLTSPCAEDIKTKFSS